jgi:hypothetical protein
VRPYAVSHLNAKLQNWQRAGIYFFQEKARNVHRIASLLVKYNLFAKSPNLVQQTGQYSPSLLISCSVTAVPDLSWVRISTTAPRAFLKISSVEAAWLLFKNSAIKPRTESKTKMSFNRAKRPDW